MNAALPRPDAARNLRWAKQIIAFDPKDQLRCTAAPGTLPMLCTPTISNVRVTKNLIDGRAGLNILSVQIFETLQVPYDQLHPTKPFYGVTDGSTCWGT